MKQVRILKNGEYLGVPYNKGEIWDFVNVYKPNCSINIKKDNKVVIVSIANNNSYGLEAEIIEIPEHNLTLVL